ncbi:MAG: hypothetical protein KDA49_15010, partial [Rhodospirillaceae bacterium]|nr:hypothetical protein [Rhodospirillaceae bacterium]
MHDSEEAGRAPLGYRDAAERRRLLKRLVSERKAVLLPGAANALTALVIEDLGYRALYLTGAGLTNTNLGQP